MSGYGQVQSGNGTLIDSKPFVLVPIAAFVCRVAPAFEQELINAGTNELCDRLIEAFRELKVQRISHCEKLRVSGVVPEIFHELEEPHRASI